MTDCSKLLLILPAGMKADPTKFKKDIVQRWHIPQKCGEQLITDLFMPQLECMKIYGYLNHKYTIAIEDLLKNIMDQNLDVSRMEWHFEFLGFFPFYLSIDRKDMVNDYAVQLALGYKDSVYYYDHLPSNTPREGSASDGPTSQRESMKENNVVSSRENKECFLSVFNLEKYLKHYSEHMRSPRQLVDPNGAVEELMFYSMLSTYPDAAVELFRRTTSEMIESGFL